MNDPVEEVLPRWLPEALRVRLARSPGLAGILANTGWLVGDRVVRLGMGMLVGVWVARYLGPEGFGLFSYVQAVAALFGGFATLGLDYILVGRLVKEPAARDRLMGTALGLRLAGAVAALGSSCLLVALVKPGATFILLLAAILGSGAVFQALDVIDLWFQSRVQSKFTVLAKNSAFLVLAGTKVGLVLARAPLVAFAWATFAEVALGAVLLLAAYLRTGEDPRRWRFDANLAHDLMRGAWPLILAGLAVMVYLRIDQIMLERLGTQRAVGLYAASCRLAEVWFFVPVAVVSSVMPSLVAAKAEGQAAFLRRYLKFFRIMLLLAFAIVVPMALFAQPLVLLLFGPAYAEAGPILAVQIWTSIFVFQGVAQGPWFVIENQTMLTLKRNLAGAVVNIGCNLVLIPRFGGLGAAFSSLAGQFVCNVLVNALDARTRPLFWMSLGLPGPNFATPSGRGVDD